MSGVIVVDAESFWSTCHGRDAYIRDHYLRYRHNYALFCQLLNSNLFTHFNTYAILREVASETCGPRVYLLSYQSPLLYLLALFLLCLLLLTLHLSIKNTKNIIYHLYQISLSSTTLVLSAWRGQRGQRPTCI